MNERSRLILKLIASHFVLPLLVISSSYLLTNDRYLTTGISQCLVLIVLISGYWEFFFAEFRYAYILFCEALIMGSIIIRMTIRSSVTPAIYIIIPLIVFQVYLIYLLINILIVMFKREKENIEIEFPFKDGIYRITDGGNSRISRLMNYHFHSTLHKKRKTNRSMLFATDVIKHDEHSKRFLPLSNSSYPIFDEKVYCPIDGIVFQVVSNIPDNIPYSGNYPYNTGNTIVVKNQNLYLLLGHLKEGSIKVKEGDDVKKGDYIAHSGNSGYSERPHLHFQLVKSETENYWKGNGLNVTYNGKNLYKNRILKI